MAAAEPTVVIVGGGPVGLVAAHALEAAGINFILLEKRNSIYLDVGASLVLTGGSLRVLHQLGILNSILPLGQELMQRRSLTTNCKNISDTSFYYLKRNHGVAPLAFHRAELVQSLYESLRDSAKSRVLFNKDVIDITSNDEVALVRCADGSTYEGTMVLGVDGVHSKARQAMLQLAAASNTGADWALEKPFQSTYRCLWFSVPRPTAPGEVYDTQLTDRSIMYNTGKDRGWVFLYEKIALDKTEHDARYTDKDIGAMVARFQDYPITEKLKVKDVFSQRTSCGMSNLDEGIMKQWSWGRVVLAGDACHKFTPNAGLGFQNGIQDVVALCNGLHRQFCAKSQITLDDLTEVFEAYQKQRFDAVRFDFKISAGMTRMQAWANIAYSLMSRFLAGLWIWDYIMLNWLISPAIRSSLTLDFITTEDPYRGTHAWKYSTSN